MSIILAETFLVDGIVKTNDEVTDDLVIETISTKVNIETWLIETISTKVNIETWLVDMDQTHRIGEKAGQNKPRPIIVKLSRYNVKKSIVSSKKSGRF